MLYRKPEVTRFGTFRDLTQVGWSTTPSDGFTPNGPGSTTTVQTSPTTPTVTRS